MLCKVHQGVEELFVEDRNRPRCRFERLGDRHHRSTEFDRGACLSAPVLDAVLRSPALVRLESDSELFVLDLLCIRCRRRATCEDRP